jgi:hypothetical protein
VRDLLSEVKILEERRPSVSGLECILVIADAQALVCGEELIGGTFQVRPQVSDLFTLALVFFLFCHLSPWLGSSMDSRLKHSGLLGGYVVGGVPVRSSNHLAVADDHRGCRGRKRCEVRRKPTI